MKSKEEIIAILREKEPELRASGVLGLSLFGSVARGDMREDSDVDIAVRLDPNARIELEFGIQQRLADLLGQRVDLFAEPVERPRLQANIQRDRIHVF